MHLGLGRLLLIWAAPGLVAGKAVNLTLVSFGDGPRYAGTLAYFRENAAALGFTSTLLWNRTHVERDPFFRANLTHLVELEAHRPYCAGFKALMLWRALQHAGEGDSVVWADATRHFDYAAHPVSPMVARRAVERLNGDALGFVTRCRTPRDAPSLAHALEASPALGAFFPDINAIRAPEINTATVILRNTRDNRALVAAFLASFADIATARAVCRASAQDQALWSLLAARRGRGPLNVCSCAGALAGFEARNGKADKYHKNFLAVVERLAAGKYAAASSCVEEAAPRRLRATAERDGNATSTRDDDYTFNVSAPVYTTLAGRLRRLKRDRKPLRVKVNSHTGAGKTHFIHKHNASFRGCTLLDFDDFDGANRSSALLLAFDTCTVLLGSAHLDKHAALEDVTYIFVVPSLAGVRHNVAKRESGVGKHKARWSNETYIRKKREETLGKVFKNGRQRFPVFDSFEGGVRFCTDAYNGTPPPRRLSRRRRTTLPRPGWRV